MAKERLSRLQKWILKKMYEHEKIWDNKNWASVRHTNRGELFYRLMLGDKKGQDEKKIQVLLTNSIQNLIKKDLIRQLNFVFHPYQLTEKGLSLITHNFD